MSGGGRKIWKKKKNCVKRKKKPERESKCECHAPPNKNACSTELISSFPIFFFEKFEKKKSLLFFFVNCGIREYTYFPFQFSVLYFFFENLVVLV